MSDYGQLEIKYGTPQHKLILEMLKARRLASKRKMTQYHQKWDDADDAFRAYQPESETDAVRRSKRKNLGQHDYTTIIVPYTFAVIMTAHTYLSTIFLSRAPVYQLQGRHGEAQDSVMAFEAVLEYQLTVGKHLVPLFNWLFDTSKYGFGIIGEYWERKEAFISRIIEQPVTLMGVPLLGKTKKVVQSVPLLKYEGNCLFNVRPYDWFPDPRVAITSFQQGEFCGRDFQMGWHEVLEGARQQRYFNINELANKLKSSPSDAEQGSPRVNLPDRPGEIGVESVPGPGFVSGHEQTIRIVPKLLGLSQSNRTELWKFTYASDEIIIGASPLGCAHDEFPFHTMETGFGAHEFLKMGLVEVMQPLVDTVSWLFNSHFYNVRKALNDQKVVDPSRIVMKDLTSPLERGIIRLKPEAYGTPVEQAIKQLATPDMTQNNLRDIAVVEQILQRITGIVDELMGMSGGPSRESATGVRTRTGFAANRWKTIAEYGSALGFSSMMSHLVSNTQQYMRTEQRFRIAGRDGMQNALSFVDVNLDLIAGQYDYVPVDGNLPIDRLAQANFWKELTMQLAQSPLAAQWDLMEMVSYIMRLQGEKNVDRFKLVMQPQGQIAQQAQAGNIVPIGGAGGRPRPSVGSTGGTP